MRLLPANMILLLAVMLPAGGARAQDGIEIQRMVGQSLTEVRGRIDRYTAAERRRVAAALLAEQRRAERQDAALRAQDATLRAQALAVEELTGELRALKNERLLLQLAEDFDAAIASNDHEAIRALLADTVTVNGRAVLADALASELAAPAGRPAATFARANARVRLETAGFAGERATVTALGASRRGFGAPEATSSRTLGEYEYRFVRDTDGWKIDGLAFRPR